MASRYFLWHHYRFRNDRDSLWNYWLKIGETENAKIPTIYYVNWFRKNEAGTFISPDFGENSRVLKWIFERCNGTADAVETAFGNMPLVGDIDFSAMGLAE